MKASLLALVFAIFSTMGVAVKLPATHPMMVHADGCADDVVAVVTEDLPEHQRATWAPILFVMAHKESGCRANPKGWNDDGKACGALQTHNPEREIPGATCEKVRADRKLGMRVGLRRMMRMSKECGSIGGGLTAYAMTGECPKNWVLPEIKQRLKLAGVKADTPWTPGA